ncbi:hydroxyisourate hydrolase [Psychromonas sp. RZ22]|uniref:hydroxyisourate hydrolase n=1 Tax=Psychromonas algarum TaxID=2555643 RepID=UPI001067384F|nr:hydroxyisourate hydrolase [Psychromonas sp. RZ22]TEW53125.1 hydroxyisourate hydrolase [Psychromonas sp. RZ22]
MKNNPITTHVLDTSLGKPASGITIELLVQQDNKWRLLSSAVTNEDGRITDWQDNTWYQEKVDEQLFGTYKIVFLLEPYWQQQNLTAFYPSVDINFKLEDTRHHHIPLLLSPYGYSTYRGS